MLEFGPSLFEHCPHLAGPPTNLFSGPWATQAAATEAPLSEENAPEVPRPDRR